MRPRSKTLAAMALAQGQPQSVAHSAVAYEFPQNGRPARFVTQAEFERQDEISDFSDILWLVAQIQVTPENPVPAKLLLNLTPTERMVEFARKFLPPPTLENIEAPELSPRAIQDLLAKTKGLVERFVVNHEAIRVPIKAVKEVGWFPPKSTWTSPEQQPGGSWVEVITTAETLPAAFLLRVADLLERRGQQIAVCAEPSCHRIFARLRRKHQQYCSLACSQKVRTGRLAVQPDWAEKRRALYLNEKERKAKAQAVQPRHAQAK